VVKTLIDGNSVYMLMAPH